MDQIGPNDNLDTNSDITQTGVGENFILESSSESLGSFLTEASDNNKTYSNSRGLRILSWNINSYNERKNQILFLMNTRNYDVVLLQETRLNNKNLWDLHIPGYKKYIKFAEIDRRSRGGLVTLVKEEISSDMSMTNMATFLNI